MKNAKDALKRMVKPVRSAVLSRWMSFPKRVRCNVCQWDGRRFLSDSWHLHTRCPKCSSDVRQRLFVAALQNLEGFSFDAVIRGQRLLHFAPEADLMPILREGAASYATADFLRRDCDLKLDMSKMPEIKGGSFDVVIALDVLEHVPDFKGALEEIRRVLSPGGFGVFTVPQKDNLPNTYEDPGIVTPRERERHFGQFDHLRIFGDDFPDLVSASGFQVAVVDASIFPERMVREHVLFPPFPSKHPLATNFRKVYFCQTSLDPRPSA